MAMDMHEKHQKGLAFEDHNDVELPMLYGDAVGAAEAKIATNNNVYNLAN